MRVRWQQSVTLMILRCTFDWYIVISPLRIKYFKQKNNVRWGKIVRREGNNPKGNIFSYCDLRRNNVRCEKV